MLHVLHRVTISPALVTLRALAARIRPVSSAARPRNKPCPRGDHLPSRANCTSKVVLCLLFGFGISIMSQAMTLEPSPVDLDRTMAPSEHNGLGAAYDHYRFEDAPSPSQTSDTLDASSGPPARATAVNHPPEQFVHPLSHGQPVHPSSRPESVSSAVLPPPPPRASTPLHSPRSTRSQSLAASLGSQSPIRRKPLSPTASPLAVRFSSKSYHMKSGDLPEEPDSGYYSLDSPDLYDLGPTEGPAPVASLPTPLEPLSEEE